MTDRIQLPLTDAQLNVWFHQQIDPKATGYNIGQSISFKGKLDLERLAFAQQAVIDRFDNLRCRFVAINDEPFQVIDERVTAPTQTWDVRQQDNPALAAQEIIDKEFAQIFDLERDRLCRFGLIQIATDQWEWFWLGHHLVSDGWSGQVAMQYMAEVYLNPEAAIKPVETSWAQTVANALTYRGSDTYLKDQQYWQTALAGFESTCSLANNRIPVHAPNIPAFFSYLLPRNQYDRIVTTGHRLGTTPFSVFVAIYAIYLSRITSQSDICLSMPTLGRDKQARLAGGMMSNPVVLRIAIQPYDSVGDIIRQVSGTMRGVLRHSRYPAYDIKQIQNVDSRVNPLSLGINLQSYSLNLNYGTVTAQLRTLKSGPVGESALRIYDNQDDGPVELKFEYEPNYFNSLSVVKHLERLNYLLRHLPEADTVISSVKILEDTESRLILEHFQGDIVVLNQGHTTLPELFEQQVARTPEAIALVSGTEQLSYHELDARANQLARHLISLGIGPERIVAIALPRSIEMVVALLAVLKSGAAYLPLDPDYPTARLGFMLNDSGASLLITQTGVIQEALDATQKSGTAIPALKLDDATTQSTLATLDQAPVTQAERVRPLAAQNLAYLIYTSGSTGRPKGVGNTHLNVTRLLGHTDSWFSFNTQDVWTLFHSIAFDFSVWEIWGAFAYGGALVLVPDDIRRSPLDFLNLLQQQRVTVLNQTPAAFEALASHAVASNISPGTLSLRYVIFGGAALNPVKLVEWNKRFVAPNPVLINMYGITETTVHVTYKPLIDQDFETDVSPIGKSISDLSTYVLDAALNPLPFGVAGELYIAGAGLARGYLGRAGLTAERFVANPFTPSARMYRSGDLARWTEGGVLEYLGRADAQVKIRGFRIELGEIEAALASIPGVAQCTVQARGEDGAKQLVAYLVAGVSTGADVTAGADAKATILETSALRSLLATTLPDYMVPAAFVVLDALPLTPNGKLDVRALPAPEITGEGEYRAPVTEHERLIAELFTELTGATRVGLDDSFFALGGDSIRAIRLVSLARARHAYLTVRMIFEYPSVQALAAAIEVRHKQALILKPEAGAVLLTSVQTQFLQLSGSVTQFNQAVALVVPEGGSMEQVRILLNKLVAHHDALRLALTDTPSGRSLWLQDEAPALEIVTVDLSAQDADAQSKSITKLGEDLSKRLDPYVGQMLAATWVTTSRKPGARAQLLLAIHHLAVDGVSWRILFEDLEHLRIRNTLPARTHSVRDWARALALQSTTRERELSDWYETLAGAQALGTDASIAPEHNRMGDARHHVSLLSQELASALGEVARTYHTGMDEVLLAALGLALTAWQQTHYGLAPAPILIDLESHGRQSDSVSLENATPLDITHTVGWFTSVYPVRLDASALDLSEALAGGEAAGLMLRATKERIAKMPDKGLGFGILRYLNEKTASVLSALPHAQILFNYLGRFEQSQSQEGWYPNTFVVSPDDMDRARMHEIDVNAAFDEQGRLQVVWSHHPLQHLPTHVEDLALRFEQALNALVRHSNEAPLAQRHTPSDFALAHARGLDQALLDRWPQATEVWPLTPLQQGLGFESLALADPTHDPYRVQLRMTLTGHLDSARLKRALEALLERHPILSLALPTEMLEKGLGIRHPQGVDFALIAADESALSALILEDLHTPFDLERGPLLRVRLIQTAPDVHHLILANHHTILDGWSMPIVIADLAALYRAEALPPALAWVEHLKWLAAQDTEAAQHYWREHLAGQEPGALWLTHSKLPHGKLAQTAGAHQEQTKQQQQAKHQDPGEYIEHLSPELSAGLERFARHHSLTLANVLQSIYLLLLARLSARDDITIGVTRSGRSAQRAGIDRAVGLYISTMPLRAQLDLSQPLVEWMREVQTEFAQQDEHMHLGLQNVQQLVGQQTLFDSLFVFENYPIDHNVRQFAHGIDIEHVSGHDATHYGLALAAMMSPNGLVLRTTYDQTLLEAEQIQRIIGHLTQMVQTIATEPVDQLCLGELRWFAQTERHQVLELFNQTEVTTGLAEDTRSNEATTLPELFEQQVARTPEATALVFGEARLTYRELDARANQLARHLIGLGIGPEQIVAIALPRSIEMVVALLAVLKSGAAYLPLDPDYPTARLGFMLTDSGASLLITQTDVIQEALDAAQKSGTALPVLELGDATTQSTLATLNEAPVTQAERLSPLRSQNLAYLIYTSGSTGAPKGAGNTHGGSFNSVDLSISQLKLSTVSRALQFKSFAFDASFLEIMPVLCSGGALYLIDDAAIRQDPVAVGNFIETHQISHADIPPVMLLEIPLESLSSLHTLIVGGEASSADLVRRHASHCRMFNCYGPTEAAVCVAYAGPLDAEMDAAALVPIGRPVQNTQIYILDASLNPLPAGVAGELYIAGAGLARGYLGRAGLTAERFVANPFTPAARMYRSGDLARWTEDGVLEYLGRIDTQVKIRGFRIELGEIEAALASIPGVAQCTVQARGEDGAKQLVAYLVAGVSTGADVTAGADVKATILETSALRSLLATTLPDYMVPAAFVVLDCLPLTPNGKLDVRALPAPEITGEAEYRAPVTEHEQLVASLFTELTGATRVGLDDSFFALGGHSLLAMRLLSQLRARTGLELALRILFERPTVAGLAQALDQVQAEVQALAASGAVSVSRPPIIPGQGVVDPEADGTQRVLSYGQIRLWTLTQIEGASGSYNMPAALKLSGVLQSRALELALSDVIERHEPLRTVIANVDGEPLGYVQALDAHTQILELEDLSRLQEPAQEAALAQLIARDSTAPFDLSRDLMVRARLIKLTDTEHVLTLVMHHIAGDGVSMGVFCKELTHAYQARTQGVHVEDHAPDWTPLAVSYADHAAWQRAWLEDSGELARQSQSWQAQLAGIPERLSLPTDYSREASRSRAARYLPLEISAQTTAHLQHLANQHQTTLFTVLIALYGTLLARLANQNEVIIGSPVAGRTTSEVDGHIGFFVNTLALRVDASDHPDLNTLMERVKGSVNHALTHQDLPFERLVEDLGVARSLSHTPVFQAMLAWQTQQVSELSLGHLAIDSVPVALAQTKFDLTLSLAPEPDGAIRGMLEYDASLFTEGRVAQWVRWFVRTLDQTPALSAATTPVDTLSLLDDAERHQVLELFNQTDVCLDALETSPTRSPSTALPELFEQQVARTPEATALVFGEASLTYIELDARANQLSRHLIGLSIGPEQIVAIALPRSIEMVVALLAVLKSGAAYLPLDPDYPAARLAFMLNDSGASLLITQTGVIQEALDALQTSDTKQPVLELDDATTQSTLATLSEAPVTQAERVRPLTSQNLAYLIYTSGSTGTPKGAGNTQSALINRLDWMQSKLQLTSVDRVLQKTPWSFDVSIWEFLLPVFNGATLVVAKPEGHKDPRYLEQLICEQGITTLHFVPSMLDAFLASDIDHALLTIRHLVTSGEALSGSLQHQCLNKLPNTLLWNFYGPTEAAIDVTYWQCRETDGLEPPPIGHPIWNTQIYILDASLNPLPAGVAGELYIAGAGLARGYLGRAGLTAERFVANPFTPGARMYRSGDLARWTEDGVLEYLGRADAQVKIRGFRIELGEIEAALASIPGVAQCTVQARGEDGAKQLVAYLVAGTGTGVTADADVAIPETSALRSLLATTLPDYMVPAAFVVLDCLPLTPNGKLDVRALPAPEITGEAEYRAPVTEHEQLVASLFTELTGATRVGLDDSFFALGGHSLLAMRLLSQLRARTGLELALRILFEYPTVETFASQLEDLPTKRIYQPLLPLNKAGSLPPLFCFPPAGGVSTVYKNLSDALGPEHPLWGLQARGVGDDENQTDQTVREAARTYTKAIKQVQPSGPYYLMGHSLGGTVAHEAAVQLEASGDTVAALFLLDTAASYPQPEADSKSASDAISEFMISQLKETTDQELPPAFDDMLNLFQRKFEALGMIPVGTPKSYVLSTLKNIAMSAHLTKNHSPNLCRAEIFYFRATKDSEQNKLTDNVFNWQPYTDKPVRLYEVPVTHVQMLWQPVSFKFIANKVHEVMTADEE